MTKQQKPTLTRSQQKRCDVLAAAELVFIEYGYQGTSMDHIAQRANVSKRTIYNHFASKQELFQQITNRLIDAVEGSTAYPYHSDQPLEQQLTEILSAEWKVVTSQRLIELSRVILSEYMQNPAMAKQTMERIESSESGLKAWLKSAVADKRLKDMDTEFASEFLSGAIKSLAHIPLLYCDRPAPVGKEKALILEEIIGMFLGRYGIGGG